MAKTYLQLVNNVLTRLREQTVTSVSDTAYSSLIGVLVNDAKREIEDAHDWQSLADTILVNTVGGTASYALVGSGQRFRVSEVINDTHNAMMEYVDNTWIQRQYYIADSTQQSAPYYFSYDGVDGNGDTKVNLFPVPDGVYQIRWGVTVPQDDLSSDGTTVKVPAHLVELLAYAKAVGERGEDGGGNFAELYQMYRLALADAVSIEKNRSEDEVVWSEV